MGSVELCFCEENGWKNLQVEVLKKMQNFIEKRNIVELNVMNVKNHFEKNVRINLLESVSFAVDLELVLMF